jgi:hypothetical protein
MRGELAVGGWRLAVRKRREGVRAVILRPREGSLPGQNNLRPIILPNRQPPTANRQPSREVPG